MLLKRTATFVTKVAVDTVVKYQRRCFRNLCNILSWAAPFRAIYGYGKISKVISIDDTRITHANDSGKNTFHPNRIN